MVPCRVRQLSPGSAAAAAPLAAAAPPSGSHAKWSAALVGLSTAKTLVFRTCEASAQCEAEFQDVLCTPSAIQAGLRRRVRTLLPSDTISSTLVVESRADVTRAPPLDSGRTPACHVPFLGSTLIATPDMHAGRVHDTGKASCIDSVGQFPCASAARNASCAS